MVLSFHVDKNKKLLLSKNFFCGGPGAGVGGGNYRSEERRGKGLTAIGAGFKKDGLLSKN
jgi:hypothetical protein